MDYAFEQKVRERAYEIWQSAGMSDGLAEEHWFSAEQSVKSELPAPKKVRGKVAKSAVSSATKKETVAKTVKSAAASKSPIKARAKVPAKSTKASAPTIN